MAATQQPASNNKGLRRKLVVIVAAVAVCVVILVALFVPQGGAIIPLEVKYDVGEKMMYQSSHHLTMLEYHSGSGNKPADSTFNQNLTVEVTGFDGQYYTLNYSYVFEQGYFTGSRLVYNYSLVYKISKQGYSISPYQGSSESNSSGSQNPVIAGLLNREEVRVGETWTVPVNSTGTAGVYSGNVTLTFQGFEDITVPAGTFHVFRVDSVGNMTIQQSGQPTRYINQNGTMYMELSTCRQIKSSITQTMQSPVYTSMQISSHELVELIQP